MRIHELLLLKLLLQTDKFVSKENLLEQLKAHDARTDSQTLDSMLSILELSFYKDQDKLKYGNTPYVTLDNNNYFLNKKIADSYKNNTTFKLLIDDVIKTGLLKATDFNQLKPLTVGKKYTRKDACRLLNWEKDYSSTIYGYKQAFNTCPLFITYAKSNDIDEGIKYENEFLNSQTMRMFTRHPRKIDSKEIQAMVQGNQAGKVEMPLFVKKSDDEGTDFYYLGLVNIDPNSVTQESMTVKGKEDPVVTMNLMLENPVQYNLYLNLTKD